MDYPISSLANSLARNPIRDISVRCRELGGLSLAGGRPPCDTFPLVIFTTFSHHPVNDAVVQTGLVASGPDGHTYSGVGLDDDWLNYGAVCSIGHPLMRDWTKKFTQKFHTPR